MSVKIQNPESFRENIRSKLRSKLASIMESVEEKTAINIEKGVFNYTIQECGHKRLVKKWENPAFVQIYSDRLRAVFINMDCPTVSNGLKSGDILPQSIAFMTHQEFRPEKWNTLIDKKTKRDASKCNKKVGASTDMFKCSRCQSKNCTYYEMQTRSADEPATIFITCLTCDKHWRI